jgi:8-oxo-dGTP diphosphatase
MNSLTSAVAAVISDPAGRVLLCQQSQGHRLWGLPGGRVRHDESPLRAAVRDIREEVGADVTLLELVGLYQLTGGTANGLPDVLVHVFRARVDGEVTVNSPGRIARLSWHDPASMPAPMMATTRTAIADAVAGRAGVLRTVHRDAEPDIPDASGPEVTGVPAQPATGDLVTVNSG